MTCPAGRAARRAVQVTTWATSASWCPPSLSSACGAVKGRALYWVVSPDGDVWEELLSGASSGDWPSGGDRLPDNDSAPTDGRKFYSARSRPGLSELVQMASRCREAIGRRGQVSADGPFQVELLQGRLVNASNVFPSAPPPPAGPRHRLTMKQHVSAGDGAAEAAAVDGSIPTPPAAGRVRMLAEPLAGMEVGAVVDVAGQVLFGSGIDALWIHRGRAVRPE
ncbi:unnamed protein product [Prorocentrum cordatum]|uniref:Uncharacterized protein n=1 Tax=Prorocentrum cordatum TaxID=2364126 RepID=A0ABN9WS09_9DINO|nr:unnamed protein product [Polarella glacialis]